MFTGLVQRVGQVVQFEAGRLSVSHGFDISDPIQVGESIAVNGCCLTALNSGDSIDFDLSEETIRRTNLGFLQPGSAVNLERAMRLSDRLGGHLVQGHVDSTGFIRSKEHGVDGSVVLQVELNEPTGGRYLIDKGSVTLDGVSLTVVQPALNTFACWIIPHTLANTNLQEREVGDRVNVEFDVLAKHVERLLSFR